MTGKADDEVRELLPLKPVDFLVLAVLHERPLHGYGIVQSIGERTDGRVDVRPGDVYRILYRLERDGLLEREPGDAGDDEGRRTYYGLTELGRRAATEEARLMARISGRLLSAGPGEAGR